MDPWRIGKANPVATARLPANAKPMLLRLKRRSFPKSFSGGEMSDPVNHPKHYTQHPSGIECIQVTEHFNFNIGNAIKYLWRQGLKNDSLEDLKKARWYVDREISRLSKEQIADGKQWIEGVSK
jgi:hypothetical protein